MSKKKLTPDRAGFDATYPRYCWAPLVSIGLQLADLWVRKTSGRKKQRKSLRTTMNRTDGSRLDPSTGSGA